jgi:transposase InsO family protein
MMMTHPSNTKPRWVEAFGSQRVAIRRILFSRYQLYLAIESIGHSKAKARIPQSNGICERFHRTMKDEFYSVAFRKKI